MTTTLPLSQAPGAEEAAAADANANEEEDPMQLGPVQNPHNIGQLSEISYVGGFLAAFLTFGMASVYRHQGQKQQLMPMGMWRRTRRSWDPGQRISCRAQVAWQLLQMAQLTASTARPSSTRQPCR